MSIRIAACSIAVLLSLGRLSAEVGPIWDDLAHAFSKVAEGLAAGEDRAKLHDGLTAALKKNKDAESHFLILTRTLAEDLKESAKSAPKPATSKEVAASPLKHLRDTKFEPFLLGRFDAPVMPLMGAVVTPPADVFKNALAAAPDDPVSRLVAMDRAVITELIPLLADRTPTRAYQKQRWSHDRLRIPRVCDYALLLIEYHSLCTFHDNASSGELLHELPDIERPFSTTREKIAKRVAEWWKTNQNKSIAAGLRDQIAYSNDAYGKFAMVRRLLQHEDPADKEFALETLRAYVRRYPGNHTSAIAGEMLAQHGDFTLIDEIYKTWHPFRDKPGHYLYESVNIQYLCKYGRRREWELLHDISASELSIIDKWPGGRSMAYGSVVHNKHPYAIPLQGLVLAQTRISSVRWVGKPAKEQPISSADAAIVLLQEQTGKDFGYKVEGTAAERAEAIKLAQKWWDDEGKAKYTFDYIEKNMVKKETPKKP